MINKQGLKIIKILFKEEHISMSALALRLNVSKKTIERNIIKLKDDGIPIAINRGRAGGVTLSGAVDGEKFLFSKEMILKQCLALKIFDSIYETDAENEMLDVCTRINPYYLECLSALEESLEIQLVEEKLDLYRGKGVIGKLFVEEFSLAIRLKQVVRLRIRNQSKELYVTPVKIILKYDGVFFKYIMNEEEYLINILDVTDVKRIKE